MKKVKFYTFLCCLVAISLVLTPAITLVGNPQQTNRTQTTTEKAAI